MGCGSSKDKSPPPAATAAAADGFVNGSPAAFFPYDERRRCTERGNGLLFRLTNRATRQWAFYNDSDALAFHVAVTFSPHSRVAAIGRTALAALPGGGGFVAKTVVAPRATAAFVEGEIDGFDAVYQAVVVADTREEREKEKGKRKRKEKGKEKGKDKEKGKEKGKEKSRRKEEGKGKDKGKSKETKGEEEM